MKLFCGMSHWQWSLWQYDRRLAYAKTYKPVWRAMNDPYFIRNTSDYVRGEILRKDKISQESK